MCTTVDVDKVLVNGKEVAKASPLAALMAACSFLGISGSGPNAKRLTHNKKMELLNAKSEAEDQETRKVLGHSDAKMPDEARLTHMPYANWCKEWIEQRARPDRHERAETKSAREVCWVVASDSQTGSFTLCHWEARASFVLLRKS